MTDPPSTARLLSVQVGGIAPLGPEGVPSGFIKSPVAGRVEVTPLGLVGDRQADLCVHGGPEKAVYGYGLAAYEVWRQEVPQHAPLLQPGAFGENLTIDGEAEEIVCLGDVVGIGSATLQICQPRQPCFKFALRFADKRMPRAMIKNGRSGWYYRVITPGMLAAGDPLRLLDRPNPHWPLSRFNALLAARTWTTEAAMELATLPGLASQWQQAAREALARLADSAPR